MLSHRRKIIYHHHPWPLPYAVRLIAWIRAIRWFGWGFGESLIPVFIFLFAHTFAEAGLLRSVYEIVSLAALPVIGVWADRISAKGLILLALALYPFVGVAYFLAGLFGVALFIVLARAVNGITWELENIGVDTYYRRTASHTNISTSFGYIDTWSHFAWIVAALIGMLLVRFVPVHYLLFVIAPTSVISYLIALRIPKDKVRGVISEPRPSFLRSYASALREWRTWDSQLWLLGGLVFFSGIVNALMWFFIPIDAYLEGTNLSLVVLLTVVGAVPSLLGYSLGRVADTKNKYSLIVFGLLCVALVMVGLGIFPQYIFKLIGSFLLGIVLELLFVVRGNLITFLGPSETFGRRGSAFESIVILGDLIAPLILGISLDVLGFSNVAYLVAAIALVLCLVYRVGNKK